MRFILSFDGFLKKLSVLDFVPLLLIRVYLFFVFWFAGVEKIENLEKFSGYLGALGVPLPDLASWLVIIIESGGGALLLVGLFVRWVSLPLLVVMFFAGYLVHYENGWPHEANGIEFASIYGVMLFMLLSLGGGKYMSLDYWVSSKK